MAEILKITVCIAAGIVACFFIVESYPAKVDTGITVAFLLFVISQYLPGIWHSRSARELWLGNRQKMLQFIGAASLFVLIVRSSGKISFLVSMTVTCLGVGIANAVSHFLGWNDEAIRQEIRMRELVLQIAVSIAQLDGRVSDSEYRQLVRLGRKQLGVFGTNFLAYIEPGSLKWMPPEQAGAGIAMEFTQTKELILADLCHVLFADGDLDEIRHHWLRQFIVSAGIQNYGVLSQFTRLRIFEDPARSQALQTLELPPTATSNDIKAAYKELAKKYHPDRQMNLPDHASDLVKQKMMRINEAYAVLTNHVKDSELNFRQQGAEAIASTDDKELICQCWICNQWMTFPVTQSLVNTRCNNCHALAGLTK